jgi:BRCA1-associated protein 2
MVCVLAVPSEMPIADFVHFTGPYQKAIANVSLFLALLTFPYSPSQGTSNKGFFTQ